MNAGKGGYAPTSSSGKGGTSAPSGAGKGGAQPTQYASGQYSKDAELDALISGALGKAGQFTNAYGAFDANPGAMDPFNTPSGLNWHGTGRYGRQALVDATHQLNAQYGKGNYSQEDKQALAYDLYKQSLADYISGGTSNRGRRTGRPTGFGFTQDTQEAPPQQSSGSEGDFYYGTPTSDMYDYYINLYAQQFANPYVMGAGISDLGKEYYNPYTKPTGDYGGLTFGTDIGGALYQHPEFQELLGEGGIRGFGGRGAFSDYVQENYTQDQIDQMMEELYFNNLRDRALFGRRP